MKYLHEHNVEVKTEIDNIIDIFNFVHHKGDLDNIFYDDVSFIKEHDNHLYYIFINDNLYQNIGYKQYNSYNIITISFIIDFKSKYLQNTVRKFSSTKHLLEYLKLLFPTIWNRYKRKKVIKELIN